MSEPGSQSDSDYSTGEERTILGLPSEYQRLLYQVDREEEEREAGNDDDVEDEDKHKEQLEKLNRATEEVMNRMQALERELLAGEDHTVEESVPNLLNNGKKKSLDEGSSSSFNLLDTVVSGGSGQTDTGKDLTRKQKQKHTFDTYLQTTRLFEKHGTLPSSNDWGERLKLLRLFYPHMIIENISMKHTRSRETTSATSLEEADDYNNDATYLQFDIFFPKFFRFQVLLDIEKATETVHNLVITILEGTSNEMSQIKDLIQFVEQRHDISLFMYSMHSYISLWKTRIATFGNIYDNFLVLVDINGVKKQPKGFRPLSDVQQKIHNFAKFKTEISIELSTVKRSKVHNGKNDDDIDDEEDEMQQQRPVPLKHSLVINWRLNWKLAKGDQTGECYSFIDVSLIKRDLETDDIVAISDLSDTLNGMIITDGIYAACTQLIDGVLLTH